MKKERTLVLTLLAAILALPVSGSAGEEHAAPSPAAKPALGTLVDCKQKSTVAATTTGTKRQQLVAERQAMGALQQGEHVRYNPEAAKRHGSRD